MNHPTRALLLTMLTIAAARYVDDVAPSVDDVHLFERALEIYQQRDWGRAEPFFDTLTKQNPYHPLYWYRLGIVRYELGRFDDSVAAFDQARRLRFRRFDTAYRTARSHARAGRSSAAIEALRVAFEAGSGNANTIEFIERDEALTSLRDEPDFRRLVHAGVRSDMAQTDAWLDDLDFLVNRIEATHHDLFHAISAADWRRAVDETKHKISTSSDLEIVGELKKLLALVGDSHTFLDPSSIGDAREHRLPIMLYEFEDGLFRGARTRSESAS